MRTIWYFVGIIDFILSALTYMYYRQNFPFPRTMPFLFIYTLLAANTIISRLLPASFPLPVLKISAFLGGLWIAFIYYSLLLLIIHLIFWIFSKILSLHMASSMFTTFGVCFIILFIAWGSWRAFHPDIRREEIFTSKLAPSDHYKIVVLSDIHLGRVLGRSYALELAKRVNMENPDFVLIAGDIIDEGIDYINNEDSLSALATMKPKNGIYVAFGNHDYIDRPTVWKLMLKDAGMTVLQDDSYILDNKIKLTGLHDFRFNQDHLSLYKQSKHNDAYYSIVIEHQPRKIDKAAKSGYDLYVAGHTHTGQLFPNRLVTKKMYKLDYGRAEFNGMTAIVSNGYGFWGPPVRTEVRPEMIVIDLKGKK